MQEKILNKQNNALAHVLFWVLSSAFLFFIFFLRSPVFSITLIAKAIITNIGFALGVYINLYVLIPKFLKQKHYIFYIFWLVVLLTLSSLISQLAIVYPLRNILEVSEHFQTFSSDTHSAFFFATLMYVAFTSFLKFIKDWISLQDLNYKIEKVEKEKLQAELKTLKGQLNPHFLFNSLNNIYSLALIQSDRVPELILKLSDLMRHIIYESRENYISLQKEIEFVDNFIALQKIRTNESISIVYNKPDITPAGKIVPLIFEPFIDNAFKHGIPGTDNDFIKINLLCNNDRINFMIQNNYSEVDTLDRKNSGIGIENVKQRLHHLYKKEDYSLDIKTENNIHSVELSLKLK